jgi:MFS family permease
LLLAVALLFQRETYHPTVMAKKVKRLRKETGNEKLRSALQSPRTPRELFLLSIIRPTKMLLFSPIIFGLSLYIAVGYGYLYLVFTTIVLIFEQNYNVSASNVGLVYLGIGVGQFLGLIVFGAYSDKLLKKLARGGEMKPEYRLPLLWPGAILLPVGLLIYGWTAQYRIFWFVPILGTTLLGAGMITTFMPIGTYLVDAYTVYAASAMAANTVLRSLGGAFLPLAGRQMYAALGLGWGNTLLALVALGMSPMIWFFNKYGERIRNHPRFNLNL